MKKTWMCTVLVLLLGIASDASAALIGPVYPPPNGVDHTGSSGSQGTDAGRTWLYDIGDFSVTSALYWGLWTVSGPLADTLSQPFTYDSTTAAGVIYDGASNWSISTTTGPQLYETRLVMNVYDYTGMTNLNNLLVSMASVGIAGTGLVLPVTTDFRVNLQFQARPAGSGGSWDSVLDTFTLVPFTTCTAPNCVVTSTNGQFWYEVAAAPEPASLGLLGISLLALGGRLRRRWLPSRAS